MAEKTPGIEKENSKEGLEIKEKIKEVLKLKGGVAGKAQIVLILLDEKPAIEFDIAPEYDQTALAIMEKIGLKAAVFPSEKKKEKKKIVISKSEAIINELKDLSPASDHRRYGELMGFPDTAIDAFLDKTKRLDSKEKHKIAEGLPHFFAFKMSKEHVKEELALLIKWNKLILEYAPELFDQLYPPEEAAKFKKNVEQR